jgi:hypothetical protein
MRWSLALFVPLLIALPALASDDLAPPVLLEDARGPINVNVGHAAPYVCDWDGDGKDDLLVGMLGGGRLRIYKNVGTTTEPRFEDFVAFKVGESEGTVPTG